MRNEGLLQLEILINYWLNECNDEQFCNFQDKYINFDYNNCNKLLGPEFSLLRDEFSNYNSI